MIDFVGFVDSRERLVEILASCDVCISPEPKNRLNEHSTLIKVAEYMAVGKPIVAFDLHETRTTAQGAATLVTHLSISQTRSARCSTIRHPASTWAVGGVNAYSNRSAGSVQRSISSQPTLARLRASVPGRRDRTRRPVRDRANEQDGWHLSHGVASRVASHARDLNSLREHADPMVRVMKNTGSSVYSGM